MNKCYLLRVDVCCQSIRYNPRPVGFKNLVYATSNGVVVNFEIFQGAGTFKNRGLGHGPSIFIRLIKTIPKSIDGSIFHNNTIVTSIRGNEVLSN